MKSDSKVLKRDRVQQRNETLCHSCSEFPKAWEQFPINMLVLEPHSLPLTCLWVSTSSHWRRFSILNTAAGFVLIDWVDNVRISNQTWRVENPTSTLLVVDLKPHCSSPTIHPQRLWCWYFPHKSADLASENYQQFKSDIFDSYILAYMKASALVLCSPC